MRKYSAVHRLTYDISRGLYLVSVSKFTCTIASENPDVNAQCVEIPTDSTEMTGEGRGPVPLGTFLHSISKLIIMSYIIASDMHVQCVEISPNSDVEMPTKYDPQYYYITHNKFHLDFKAIAQKNRPGLVLNFSSDEKQAFIHRKDVTVISPTKRQSHV